MSGHLKNIVKKIISENQGSLTLDEIIISVKNLPEYQRTKIDSLKPTIKKVYQELKKDKEKDKDKELNTNSQTFLNKKQKKKIKSQMKEILQKRKEYLNKFKDKKEIYEIFKGNPLNKKFEPIKFIQKSNIEEIELNKVGNFFKFDL